MYNLAQLSLLALLVALPAQTASIPRIDTCANIDQGILTDGQVQYGTLTGCICHSLLPHFTLLSPVAKRATRSLGSQGTEALLKGLIDASGEKCRGGSWSRESVGGGSPFLPSTTLPLPTYPTSAPSPYPGFTYPAPPSATYFTDSLSSRLEHYTPSSALHNAAVEKTRYVRFRVVPSSGGYTEVAAAGEGGRVAVGGKDSLRIIKFLNRPPLSSPSSPPPGAAFSERGYSRRGRSKVLGPGGSSAEEVMNVWAGSKLSLVHALQDVAWGHQNYSEKLLTAHLQGDCLLWDLQRPGSKVESILHEHVRGRGVNRVLFAPGNGGFVLSASVDMTCKLWDLRKPQTSVSTFKCNAAVSAICFSPVLGSSDFVAGLGNGALQRFDYRMGDKGMVDWISSAHASSIQDLKWRESSPLSPLSQSQPQFQGEDTGSYLASCGMDKLVKIWDMDPSSGGGLSGTQGGREYGSFAGVGVGVGGSLGTNAASSVGTASFPLGAGGPGGGSTFSTLSTASSASAASVASASSQGQPHNRPKQVLRTPCVNHRIAWRPGYETELVVVPYRKYGVSPCLAGVEGEGYGDGDGDAGDGDGGGEGPEETRISVWDVRRNYLPKYVLLGGTGAARDVLFLDSEPDAVIATYSNSYVVQHDLRHHTRPIDGLSRSGLSWDGTGRLAFAVEERGEGEVPFDEPPYDPHTRMRMPGGKEHSIRAGRFLPTSQLSGGLLLPNTDTDSLCRIARGYLLTGEEKHVLCQKNAAVAQEGGNEQAAQGWMVLHSLLVPLPLPSRSSSPAPHSTPGQKSSKFSYSPLSGSSRRATSKGPKRARRPLRPRGRRSTPSGPGTGDEPLPLTGESHLTQGALDSDSDSDGDEGDESGPDVSDAPVSPVEREDRSGSASGSGRHTRNQNSESSVSSSGAPVVGNNMRSPLSRTPVTADMVGILALRRLSKMEEEEYEEVDSGLAPWRAVSAEAHMNRDTGNEMEHEHEHEHDLESSSSAAEGGLMLKRGKPALKHVTTQFGQFHSSHGTRRNSMESEREAGFVRGHKRTISGGSGAPATGRTSRSSKKLTASPAAVDLALDGSRHRQGWTREKEIIDAEQRIRDRGWEVMRTMFEGMMLEGDVQTCAVMAIVAGEELVKDQTRIVRLVVAYLEVLSRLLLFTAAAEVRKYFKAPEVQEDTNSNTRFDSSCARCRKALRGEALPRGTQGNPGNYLYCKNCHRMASRCAICHLPSKGLFFLCPTCGHGGHEECYRDYYLFHPMDNVHIVLQSSQSLQQQSWNSRQSISLSMSDSNLLDEDDRTGRTTNPKRLRRAPPGRVHPVEAADDTDDEAQKARYWDRKRKMTRKVLLGHPCVAGCGHFRICRHQQKRELLGTLW
ncbi:hypothetical protein DACRYDRAFT_99424 [Dacryopinax primogenitus]|uniref:Uncharacterized protein n=1 Tax=Dacryopinax primogenitus (strain DJM 731) TaxID=1858805 RepID=M5G2S3_DACPD|nr:uncharacterized protein DACRYDRAFT_99424 [Dacryopinax primogenitus]EJU02994.1 hypothetical protein DACRYDRAFT_99424 [Dacryopinax primogenitus]